MTETNRLNAENQYLLFPSAPVYLANSLTANPRVTASHYMEAGKAVGRLFKRVYQAIDGAVGRAQARRQLLAMDDRMLDDIGLTRGDIEAVISGTLAAEKAEPAEPVAQRPEISVVAHFSQPAKPKAPKVEAILRRAA